MPDDEPVEKQPFHGSKSIGGDEEKGIIFHDSYYSCLKLSFMTTQANYLLKLKH